MRAIGEGYRTGANPVNRAGCTGSIGMSASLAGTHPARAASTVKCDPAALPRAEPAGLAGGRDRERTRLRGGRLEQRARRARARRGRAPRAARLDLEQRGEADERHRDRARRRAARAARGRTPPGNASTIHAASQSASTTDATASIGERRDVRRRPQAERLQHGEPLARLHVERIEAQRVMPGAGRLRGVRAPPRPRCRDSPTRRRRAVRAPSTRRKRRSATRELAALVRAHAVVEQCARPPSGAACSQRPRRPARATSAPVTRAAPRDGAAAPPRSTVSTSVGRVAQSRARRARRWPEKAASSSRASSASASSATPSLTPARRSARASGSRARPAAGTRSRSASR